MHYVGNWSIVMGDGEASLQLLYSPGWTALSAFIPILALFIAFASADRRYKGGATFFFYLLAPGILAGAAVCGMHYAGNYGISNYVPHFRAGYVAGSILIACFACVAALASLFILQDLWMSSFPLRLVVAIVLAATVSAMHWVATMGTFYTVRSGKHYHASARTTNFILAVVVVRFRSSRNLTPHSQFTVSDHDPHLRLGPLVADQTSKTPRRSSPAGRPCMCQI